MADQNCWNLIGRLTRDAEAKVLPSGTFVANFSVAVECGWGERRKTNFWKVRYFGQGASAISQWLTKGKQVAVTGEGDVDKWMSPTRGEVQETVIVARSVQLLASPAGQQQGARNPTGNHAEDEGYADNDEIPY